jgi:hypothetical protein
LSDDQAGTHRVRADSLPDALNGQWGQHGGSRGYGCRWRCTRETPALKCRCEPPTNVHMETFMRRSEDRPPS